MTAQEREAAALAEIRAVLEKYGCTLRVAKEENQQLLLKDGSFMVGTRYIVSIDAIATTEKDER